MAKKIEAPVITAETIEKYPHLNDPRAKPPWRTASGNPPFPVTHPHLMAEYADDSIDPWSLTCGLKTKVAWHRHACGCTWRTQLSNRCLGDTSCPTHNKLRRPSKTPLLIDAAPAVAARWHPTKNVGLDVRAVRTGMSLKPWWLCTTHEYEYQAPLCSQIRARTAPCCRRNAAAANQQTKKSRASKKMGTRARVDSLATRYPDLAAEWHPTKNALPPSAYAPMSGRVVWWRREQCGHEWPAAINNRAQGAGCPRCVGRLNETWTVSKIRDFVRSCYERLPHLTQDQLYVICQQAGLRSIMPKAKGHRLVEAFSSGLITQDHVDEWEAGNPASVIEALLGEPEPAQRALDQLLDEAEARASGDDALDLPISGRDSDPLPALAALNIDEMDPLRAEFMLSLEVGKLWRIAYESPAVAVARAECEVASGNKAAEMIGGRFLREYHEVVSLKIPRGYSFSVDGTPTPPSLMQRLQVVRVRDQERVLNASGTGAGKTLAAILASRVIEARLTLVVCPNNTIEDWRAAILSAYPDSDVQHGTFAPTWRARSRHRYLVLNYEKFQQKDSPAACKALAECGIEFVVLDEVHNVKQRDESQSNRRSNVLTLLERLRGRSPKLRLLVMSATPLVNNLEECRTLVELITGQGCDLNTKQSMENAMDMRCKIMPLMIRHMPKYATEFERIDEMIDVAEFTDRLRYVGSSPGAIPRWERILIEAKLPLIRRSIQPKTFIYCDLVDGIVEPIQKALEADGWRVGCFTGQDKAGKEAFIRGDLDVLIGSRAIYEGVDGLQRVCSRVIMAVLPWTAKDFTQIKGRLVRQGQKDRKVTMIIPMAYFEAGGERRSLCMERMNIIRRKRTLADLVLDGVIPSRSIPTEQEVVRGLAAWLERLDRQVEPAAA